MVQVVRRPAIVLVAAFLLACLVGCTPEASIRATTVKSQIAFAICKAIDVRSITVTTGDSKQETTTWQVSGKDSWPAGYVLRYGDVPPGWDVLVPARKLDYSAPEVTLYLNDPTVTSSGDNRAATFFPRQLKKGSWLTQDGHLMSKPCS